MTLTVWIALAAVVATLAAFVTLRQRRPHYAAVTVAPPLVTAPEYAPEPEIVTEPEPAREPQPAPITWTSALTPNVLDEAARLRLVDDLTLIAAPWALDLLRRAYEEESSVPMRTRIEAALTL